MMTSRGRLMYCRIVFEKDTPFSNTVLKPSNPEFRPDFRNPRLGETPQALMDTLSDPWMASQIP